MIKGVTGSGFAYSVDERRMRDWRTLKKISALMRKGSDAEAEIALIDLVSGLLGEGQEERLVSHVEARLGYADAEEVAREFFEIFAGARRTEEGKNSRPSPGASPGAREGSSATSPSTTASSGTRTRNRKRRRRC